jgi:tetratricopeptide (TPR) repeat protein
MGLTLTTHAEKVLLNWANRGLIMVGMLALPALVFLSMYVSNWFRAAAHSGPSPGLPAEPVAVGGWRKWRAPALALLVVAMFAVFVVFPAPEPGATEILAGLRRITALNPDSPQARFSLALQLEDQGKLPESQASYEASLRLNQNQVAAWFNLGNVLIRQKEYTEAARCYREALQLEPGHAGARSNLGNALFNEGRYEEAAESYQAALEIDDRRPTTHKNLGETLLHLGRRCEALGHLERSVALDARIASDASLSARMAKLRADCGSQ